ncbi:MAG TPA: hypothetical protein VFE21_11125, partial [Rubrobacteraceae bacterium]|nr:hypothetical protein [Rubrobacteraceae bacterium]
LISFEELRTRLLELEETRAVAERELAAVRGQREEIAQLERDADALMEHYAGRIPEDLDSLTPEQRRHVYAMLRLRVAVDRHGDMEITGVVGQGEILCQSKLTQRSTIS